MPKEQSPSVTKARAKAGKSLPVKRTKVAAAGKVESDAQASVAAAVTMDSPAGQDIGTPTLTAIFCDRLNQAIDRRPDVIRKGRGRVNDFKDRFGLHYTVAHRLLSGGALPNSEQLQKMGHFFGLPIGWFLGQGETDVDAEIDRSNLRIELFDPRSNKTKVVTAPVETFGPGLDTGRIIIHRISGPTGYEVVMVRVQHDITDGVVHLIHLHENDSTVLRRLSMRRGPVDSIMAVSPRTGDATLFNPAECNFGEPTDSSKKYTIIGPVVATTIEGYPSK